jgi:hypothetical protein
MTNMGSRPTQSVLLCVGLVNKDTLTYGLLCADHDTIAGGIKREYD